LSAVVNKANSLSLTLTSYERDKNRLVSEKAAAADLYLVQKEAAEVLFNAASSIQHTVEKTMQKRVNLALKDVCPETGYSFECEFVNQKTTTVLEMYLVRDGERYDPMESCGYGIVDIVCFALRVSMLWLQSSASKILILDEPFRQVSEMYRPRLSSFLKSVCADTGIQIIMVTHIPELADGADHVIHVKMADGKSKVQYG